jgi:beta-catenin-like protein 1
MESEIDLHEEILVTQRITAYPNLINNFIELNGIDSLINLLVHPNMDIVDDAVNIIDEITDSDFLQEINEPKSFLENFISCNLFELLVNNLFKLNDLENKEDAQIINDILSIIENFLDVYPFTAKLLGDKTNILNWLLSRVRSSSTIISNNDCKLFASEILDTMLQSSPENQMLFAKMEAIPHLIKIIIENKNKKIEGGTEEEFISNIFNSICSCLLTKENQEIFLKSDGVKIMINLLKENTIFRHLAIKVLDFSIQNNQKNCKEFVETDGIGPLFSYFMGKGFKSRSKHENLIEIGEEHCLGIMCSIIKFSKGVHLDRFVYKFKENKLEKCERMIELYKINQNKSISIQNSKIEEIDEDEEEDADENKIKNNNKENKDEIKYISNLKSNSGLFNIQLISMLIGFLFTVGHPDINEKFIKLFSIHSISIDIIKSTLKTITSNLGEEFESTEDYFSNKSFITEIINKL